MGSVSITSKASSLSDSKPAATWFRWFSLPYLVLIVSVLVSIRGWSFLVVPFQGLWILAEKATILGLLGTMLVRRGRGPRQNDYPHFNYFVHGLLLFSVATYIPLYLYNDQSILSSLNYSASIFYWLLYFHIRNHQIDHKDLLRLCAVVGIIWAAITIFQQFTYPGFFLFYTRFNSDLREPIEIRAGIIRFMIDGCYYAQITLFWALAKYLTGKRISYFFLFVFLLIGTYYAGTRQLLLYVMAGCALITAWHMFRKGRRLELTFVLAFITTVTVFLLFSDAIFGKLIEMTKDEANEDNIRVASFRYFMFEYWPHRLNFFLGNGMPKYFSAEGLKIRLLIQKGYFQSDVGIAGTISVFGLFYTIISTLLLVFGTLRRVRFDDSYLNATFLYLLLGLPLAALFVTPGNYPFFCILFCLMDGAINRRRESTASIPQVHAHTNPTRPT